MSNSTQTEQFSTLTELLEATGSQLRLYDMGRRICKVSRQQFLRFERYEIAWPTPLTRHLWLALLQTEKGGNEPVIWFLKLPLDEQGKLVQAARDYFVQRLAEAFMLNQSGDEHGVQDALKDNPFVFKPRAERMAAFHAKVSADTRQPASSYYAHAKNYFSGENGWDQWQFVGYQGIADLAARWEEGRNVKRIGGAIPSLPAEPLIALCHCLENEEIPYSIAEPLLVRLEQALTATEPDIGVITALIRGLSATSSKTAGQRMFQLLMQQPAIASNIEVLSAVAGRAWLLLTDPEQATAFLKQLAGNEAGQEAFNAVMRDLLTIPVLRKGLLAAAQEAAIPEQMKSLQKSLRDERNPDTSAT